MHWLSRYIADIDGIGKQGDATEASYRAPIQTMLQAAAQEFGADVDILHEPGRAKQFGSPDFRVSAKGGGVVGYVECKAPGENLRKLIAGTQVRKYLALSDNIMLTDSFQWLHLREGKQAGDAILTANPGKVEREAASELLRAFLTKPAEKISNSKKLAAALAYRCAMLRKGLAEHENDKHSRLHGLLSEFKKTLDRDLDFSRFVDIFAQAAVYTLLMARLNAPDGEKLTLLSARAHIPENFPVIREITTFMVEMGDSGYQDIHWVVSDILAIVNEMDRVAVAESMSYGKKDGKSGGDDDPYLNFYEKFLSEYNPKLRESRGAYYTPSEVVMFIVRAANDLLKRDFGMPEGFANAEKVTALDFAAGTGTFMLEMARAIFDGKSKAKRDILAREHFLKNIYGFEYMASAYVISHLKLSRFLENAGVTLDNGERIKVYLTNTLEKVDPGVELALMRTLAHEARDAQKVKDSPVLVIVGNPPYSVVSQNKSTEKYERDHKKIKGKRVTDTRDTWIGGLLRGVDNGKLVGGSYYEVDGQKLGESNTKALQDDYVKFIRFAQRKIDLVPRGIVAVITNNGFLDNPTFRGMRKSLMDTFDSIYFLDLHGNAQKREKTPEGGKDENVFDIMQGVTISLFVKNSEVKFRGVYHADLWGDRAHKLNYCKVTSIDDIKWAQLAPSAPSYFFTPFDKKGEKDYRKFKSVKDIFPLFSNGIKSHRDHFALAFSASEMKARVEELIDEGVDTGALREKYKLQNTRDWDLQEARNLLVQSHSFDDYLRQCLYRPFDARWCYYGGETMELPRADVMRNMLAGDNLALLAPRITKDVFACFCTDLVAVHKSAVRYDTTNFFPLYYDLRVGQKTIRRENFDGKFREWINTRYGEAHTPEDILGCIYACLHSPNYCKRYADFLRTEFPRVGFPKTNDEFKRLAAVGGELIAAHLLRENCGGECELRGDGTSHEVEKVRYDENAERLYFNKDEYFSPLPPDVFDFQIGGYKPLDSFLKSRKGRKLSAAEIATMEKAANAIAFTIKKTAEIDG